MDLYSEYIKERDGVSLITTERGFVTYKCIGNECFINDLFVSKEHRGGSAFLELIKELGAVAIKNGCSHLSGVIWANDPGINRTMKAVLKLGSRIIKIQNNGVIMTKELKGDLWLAERQG